MDSSKQVTSTSTEQQAASLTLEYEGLRELVLIDEKEDILD